MDGMKGAYLGPQYSSSEIQADLDKCGAVYHLVSDTELIDKVAPVALQTGNIVGWMQGTNGVWT